MSGDALSDAIPCPRCGYRLAGCHHAEDDMRLRAWLCVECGHIERPIGRERGLKPGWERGDGVEPRS